MANGARSCAGCCGTTTSSPATSRRCASSWTLMKTGETPVTKFLRGRVLGALGHPQPPSRRAGGSLCSRASDHRRPLDVRVSVLARRVRGRLGGPSPHRRMAGADQGGCPAGSIPIGFAAGPSAAQRGSSPPTHRLAQPDLEGMSATAPVHSSLVRRAILYCVARRHRPAHLNEAASDASPWPPGTGQGAQNWLTAAHQSRVPGAGPTQP